MLFKKDILDNFLLAAKELTETLKELSANLKELTQVLKPQELPKYKKRH
jgi:hypothetical protein